KRVGKEAARRAFAKVVEAGADPDALIAGAARYAVERSGEPSRYTKSPAGWLTDGRWQDEPPGAVVLDEAGNVVAFEQPQQREPRRTGFAALAEAMAAEAEANGDEWE